MKRLILGGAITLALPALSTTLIALDVPALTRAADVVVRGTVVRVEPRWTKDRARIVTDTEILVAQTYKGNVAGQTVVAMQPGGVVGDLGQKVHGVATFSLGDEVLVFLERRGDRFSVVGLAQGRLFVDREGAEPRVRGGEEELFLLDAVTHQPVPRPVQPMTLARLEGLIRDGLPPASPEPKAPTLPRAPAPVRAP
ncbi:MAG: hypothetical protein INH41_12355 [Myxococcaceae bacterium]|jgi:hypothetical protein|nr:hypothetical protein [Myxococcaceae bacterium]